MLARNCVFVFLNHCYGGLKRLVFLYKKPLSKKMGIFYDQICWPNVKIMVNNQTSQYKLLNNKKYLSHLDIFPHVRVILQYSLPLDHPVVMKLHRVESATNKATPSSMYVYIYVFNSPGIAGAVR